MDETLLEEYVASVGIAFGMCAGALCGVAVVKT